MSSNSHKKIKTAGNNIIKNTTNIPNPRKSKKISLPPNPQTNSNNSKQKKKSPLTPSINQREKNILLMQDPSGIAGNGLWCQIPKKIEDKPYESIIPKIKAENQLLLDPEKAADKKLITELKNQIRDLSLKLQEVTLKYSDAEFRAQRAENLQKITNEELQSKKDEFNDIHENAMNMENNVESLNEALNSAKKEINRLQQELNNESEINKKLNEQIEQLLKEKDKNNHFTNEEQIKLQNTIKQLNTEKENLLKIIQTKVNSEANLNIENLSSKLKEKERILKAMEITMNKALNENAELKRRLSLEENNKVQLNNIIAKKNQNCEELKSQLESMKSYVNSNLKEVEWNKSKVNQKESNIKLMKEKLKSKDEEIKNLNNKIAFLNKKLKNKKEINNNNNINNEENNKNDNLIKNQQKVINNEDGSKEIIIPVKAKPFLFGPEPADFEYEDKDLEKDIFG